MYMHEHMVLTTFKIEGKQKLLSYGWSIFHFQISDHKCVKICEKKNIYVFGPFDLFGAHFKLGWRPRQN